MTRKLAINLGDGAVAVTDGGDVDLDAVDYRTADGTRITNATAEQWALEAEQRVLSDTCGPVQCRSLSDLAGSHEADSPMR